MPDDPFRVLRLEYLDGARGRLPELEHLLATGDLAPLRKLAHNLRGSGGFYGFAAISEAAARLEELIVSAGGAQPDAGALKVAGAALAAAIVEARLPVQ